MGNVSIRLAFAVIARGREWKRQIAIFAKTGSGCLSTSALSLGVVSQQMRWMPLYHFSPSKI